MAVVLASTRGMSREAWLEARKAGIGSSDSPAVLGLDEYRSPLDVYLDKRGLLPERESNRFLRWGTALEPLVAEWFEEDTGKKVRRRLAILQHPERPYVIADVDRIVVGEGVPLEIKTASAWKADEWDNDQVPLRVVYQLQHQLAVLDAPYGYWAVLLGGNDPRWGRLDRDDALIAQMFGRYETFWRDYVEAGVEPSATKASDAALMAELHPQEVEGKTVLLPPTARDALLALSRAKAAVSEAQDAQEAAKARVQALLGDAEAAYLPGIEEPVATWRTTTRRGFTVAPTTYRKLELRERVLNGG